MTQLISANHTIISGTSTLFIHTPQSFFPVPLYVHTRNFFHANSVVLIHRASKIITKERLIRITTVFVNITASFANFYA